MKYLFKIVICSLLVYVACSFIPAEAIGNKENSEIPYSVVPIFNDHQMDKTVGYFDLLVKPGEKEDVAIEVSNHSDKEISVRITPNIAKTSSNGTIDYSGMDLKNTKNLVASFEKITSPEQVVTIPAKGSQKVSFSIDIPKQKFEGILLGGFYIQEEKDEKKQQSDEEANVAIKNEFSFIIGCQLKMTNEPVEKKFTLGGVHLDTYGGYFSVVSDITNEAPALVSSFSMDGEINDEKGKRIYTFTKETFSMAPNSVFSLPERVEKDVLKPGNYKMKLTITSQNGKKTWDVSKSFTVTSKERDAVMKESIAEQQPNMPLYIGLGVIVLLLLLIIIILIKKKNR